MPTTSPADRALVAPHPRRRPRPRPPRRARVRRPRLRDQRPDRDRRPPRGRLAAPSTVDRAPDPLDAWLPVSAVILAVLVAVRGDPFLAVLDLLVALRVLRGVGRGLLRPGRHPANGLGHRRDGRVGDGLGGRGSVPGRHREPAGAGQREPRRLPTWAAAVVRGLVDRDPARVIFAVLFASADPVFGRAWGPCSGSGSTSASCRAAILFVARDGLVGRGRWSRSRRAASRPFEGAVARRGRAGPPLTPDTRVLGLPEALVILVAVDLVFGVFVGLQVAYLFGGRTRSRDGMTYADYARRGFFELVAAACLAGGIVVVLESTVVRRSRGTSSALVALVGLTGGRPRRRPRSGCGSTRTPTAGPSSASTSWPRSSRSGSGWPRWPRWCSPTGCRWLPHTLAVLGIARWSRSTLVAPAAFVAEPERRAGPRPVARAAGRPRGAGHAYLRRPPATTPSRSLVAALPALPPRPRDERHARSSAARRERARADPSCERVARRGTSAGSGPATALAALSP